MDGQHQYEINLKKEDLFICLSSDDVYFISKQMDKWFRILLDDSYVPVSLPPWPQPTKPEETVASAVAEAAPVAPTEPVVQPVPEAVAAPLPEPIAQPVPVAPVQPEIQQPEIQQPQPVAAEQPTSESNEALAQRIMMQSMQNQQTTSDAPEQALPQPEVQAQPPEIVQPTIEAIPQAVPVQQPVVEPIPQPVMQAQPLPQPLPQPVAVGAPSLVATEGQDDFEAVMNSLLRDFEDKDPDAAPTASSSGAFRPRIEPDLSGITSLADLCDRSDAANSEDYLLLSAYYLTRMERQETFSLKKVNSVLVKSGLTPVNHSVLETVLSNGYLSMVPDLTGTAEVTEYMISAEGTAAAIALL